MLLSRFAYVRIAPNNWTYWKKLGYEVGKTGGRAGINTTGLRIKVQTNQLQPNSNVVVACACETCGRTYLQRFSRSHKLCGKCGENVTKIGNTYGESNRGKPGRCGSDHPRHNPNLKAIRSYTNQVHWLTRKNYQLHKDLINPHDYPRTRCGVEGGWQLDHKIPIKRAFALGWPPEKAAAIANLQMLSWKDNRAKHATFSK